MAHLHEIKSLEGYEKALSGIVAGVGVILAILGFKEENYIEAGFAALVAIAAVALFLIQIQKEQLTEKRKRTPVELDANLCILAQRWTVCCKYNLEEFDTVQIPVFT